MTAKILAAIAQLVSRRLRQRRLQHELGSLNDRMLDDIGIRREQIPHLEVMDLWVTRCNEQPESVPTANPVTQVEVAQAAVNDDCRKTAVGRSMEHQVRSSFP